MMIRWYRSFVRSKLSSIPSMPAPSAMISGRTFSLATILSRRAFSTFRTLPRSGRIGLEPAIAALLRRASRRVALDDEELAPRGIALLAVGELARQRQPVEGALAEHEVARLAGGLARPRGRQALLDDPAAVAGFSSRYWLRLSVTAVWTWPFTSALPSLAFVWPSNCGSVSLTLMTAVRPSRTSSPERLPSPSLSTPALRAQSFSELVSAARKPVTWRAAVDGVDVVREREDVLGVRVVVLERDLDRGRALAALDVDRAAVEGLLVPVQVPDERLSPPSK